MTLSQHERPNPAAAAAETSSPANTDPNPSVASAPDPSTSPPDTAGLARSGRPPLRALLVRAAAVLAVATLGIAVVQVTVRQLRPHLYTGTVLQAPEPAPGLDNLRFASGDPADLSRFDGQVVLVFFGYTHCPDVCPVTLANAARARAALPEADRERTRLVMLSVDPDRDDLASLQNYVAGFDPTFLAAGGDPADIQRVATNYGIYGEIVPEEERLAGHYTIDHTASVMGIGPDGRLRIVWPPNVDVERLRMDIEELLS